MRRYTKEDVEFHGDWRSSQKPAINVKCYSFPDAGKIADHYGKDADDADVQRVMEWLFESYQESFWESAQTDAENLFGVAQMGSGYGGLKVHAEGRSGGWLIVDGLKDFDEWDAIDLAKWRKFERWMKAMIPKDNAEWLESMIDTIDANEWLLTADDEAEKERAEALSIVSEIA